MTRFIIIIIIIIIVVVVVVVVITTFFYLLLSITPYMYTSWDTVIEKISSEQSIFSLCSVSVRTIRVISVIIAKLLERVNTLHPKCFFLHYWSCFISKYRSELNCEMCNERATVKCVSHIHTKNLLLFVVVVVVFLGLCRVLYGCLYFQPIRSSQEWLGQLFHQLTVW